MKQTIYFSVFSVVLALLPASADVDCLKLSLSVKNAVSAEQSKVLEIVANEVAAAPGCACEIVKASIEGSQAKPGTVAAIVEAAATAAPEQMRLISQCAVAVAPDALTHVQAVLAKLDPNRGESGAGAKSAKSAKGSKEPIGEVAAMPNPLDFPGQGPISPPANAAPVGGTFGLGSPVIIPPVEVSNVTETDN